MLNTSSATRICRIRNMIIDLNGADEFKTYKACDKILRILRYNEHTFEYFLEHVVLFIQSCRYKIDHYAIYLLEQYDYDRIYKYEFSRCNKICKLVLNQCSNAQIFELMLVRLRQAENKIDYFKIENNLRIYFHECYNMSGSPNMFVVNYILQQQKQRESDEFKKYAASMLGTFRADQVLDGFMIGIVCFESTHLIKAWLDSVFEFTIRQPEQDSHSELLSESFSNFIRKAPKGCNKDYVVRDYLLDYFDDLGYGVIPRSVMNAVLCVSEQGGFVDNENIVSLYMSYEPSLLESFG